MKDELKVISSSSATVYFRPNFKLTKDDIDAIQTLYGPPKVLCLYVMFMFAAQLCYDDMC